MRQRKPTRVRHFATARELRAPKTTPRQASCGSAFTEKAPARREPVTPKRSAAAGSTGFVARSMCCATRSGLRHATGEHLEPDQRPHVKRLSRLGKISEPGKRAYRARDGHRTGVYSFEQKRPGLAARHKKSFRENPAAWKFFSGEAPWYQRTAGYWVSSAKREDTQQRRLASLIAASAAGRRIDRLTPKAKR